MKSALMRRFLYGIIVNMLREYDNYIFDLYGTLIDISTDEHSKKMWKIMRDFYNAYGCVWKSKRLCDAFFLYDSGERQKLRVQTGVERPEIKLERVFARLLFEGCPHYACSMSIGGIRVDDLRKRYETDIEGVISEVSQSDWVVAAANLFRVSSRDYIHPYEDTIETLKALRQRGKKVYLLSNAAKIFTMPEIEATGLAECFDKMYISSDYGIMKPEKEFLQILLDEEALDPSQTVMVGNEISSDVAVAIRCGVHGIYLNTAGWSINKAEKTIEKLRKEENTDSRINTDIIVSGRISELLIS